MAGRLFLGIADNGHCASFVVGNSSGRILATGMGGSVNHRYWGREHARASLRHLVNQIPGWGRRSSLAGACITYKADFTVGEWRVSDLVSGILEEVQVKVEDFATSSILGMHGSQERLLLVGGHSAQAIYEDSLGNQNQVRQDCLAWSPVMRLNEKINGMERLHPQRCMKDLQYMKAQIGLGKCLSTFTDVLDHLVSQGSLSALELAYDWAHDLVQMVIAMSSHVRTFNPVIGLYGQVLLGSQTIRSRVHHLLGLLFPRCRIIDSPLAPATGAYLSAVLTGKSAHKHEVITNAFA